MITRTMRIAALFASVFVAAAHPVWAQDSADEIKWLDSYEDAVAEAGRTGKPIFLTFRCVP